LQFQVKQNQTIRAILGSFLLLVFVIGITPKRIWHDVFASHQDTFAVTSPGEELQVNKAGFNCDWNMQVATSPFIGEEEPAVITIPALHNPHFILASAQLYQAEILFRSLRGPPAIG
jgi:hypothetical protein